MIKLPNGTELRNLEEQVQKNKEDIARHWEVDRILADFGITVLGRVNYPGDLQDKNEGENWGYAYLVGTATPYNVYVWTRPNPNVGQETAYWLDIGSISIVGPQGPEGRYITNITWDNDGKPTFTFSNGSILAINASMRGPAGESPRILTQQETNGVRITTYDGKGTITSTSFVSNGTNGQSIVGPQGPAGSFNIKGTLATYEQLPNAETSVPGDAYLITSASGYDLWLLVGTEPALYEWVNTGTLGVGTHITVGGSAVNEWNADTKVDKITTTANRNRVYGITSGGAQTTYKISQNTLADANCIPLYNNAGQLMAATPSIDGQAANKKYVDDAIAGIPTGGGGANFDVYTSNGTYVDLPIDGSWKSSKFIIVDLIGYDYDMYANHFTACFCPDNSSYQYIDSNRERVQFYVESGYNEQISTIFSDEDTKNSYMEWAMKVVCVK